VSVLQTAVESETGVNRHRFSTVTFTLYLRRLYIYYIVNLIMPCCLLSFVAVTIFMLPPYSNDRLGIGSYDVLRITDVIIIGL